MQRIAVALLCVAGEVAVSREVLQQETLDPRSQRQSSLFIGTSAYVTLEATIRLFEQLWSHGQVPLRGLQINTAEIRRQRRKEALYVDILSVPLGHPMNRERILQVMDARLKGRFIVAFNPRERSQANEALIQTLGVGWD